MNVVKKFLKRLKARQHALEQLERMMVNLHACRTFAEAYWVIRRFTQVLLPGVSGALYVRANGTCACAASWGRFQPGKRKFALNECTALHRMKLHVVDDPEGLGCPHVVRAR